MERQIRNQAVHPDMTTTAFGFNNYHIVQTLGLVRGITVRSRSVFGTIGAKLETLFGGNISLLTSLCERTRLEAFEIMLAHAQNASIPSSWALDRRGEPTTDAAEALASWRLQPVGGPKGLSLALAMGFRSGAGLLAWLAVIGILVLFTLALTWLAVIPGLTAKSVDGVSGFSYPLIFLPFISAAFVPTDGMPGPVRWFAEHQPVTPIVNTLRNLFAGQPVGNDGWIALGWCVGLLVVAYALAIRTYRSKIA